MKLPVFDSCTSFASPVGNINVYATGEKVVYLTMGDVACGDSGKAKVLGKAKKQLEDYFKGKSKRLDFAVELHGTPFQEAVWAEIAKLGFGEVVTYADIANAIGIAIDEANGRVFVSVYVGTKGVIAFAAF